MKDTIGRRIEALLWHPDAAALPTPLRAALALVRHVYAVLRDVTVGPLPLRAMGLVYVTILSLVPLLAVSFAVLKAFGFDRQLEPFLLQILMPLGARGVELTAQIMAFVGNAQGGLLAGLGLLFLFFTAVSMAEQVESSFNYIWRVERPRSLARRVAEYIAVMLVGPVVMSAAMTLIARLNAAALMQELRGIDSARLVGPLESLAPYALVCLAFWFVYAYVPNAFVRTRAALVGGLVGGTLWAATGALFAAFVVNAATTITIYATFAIVITALFWLYLCWLILLIGAQVSFYAQNPDYMRVGYRAPVTGTGRQEQTALAVMHVVALNLRDGAGATSIAEITRRTGLPGLALSIVVNRLEAAGLLERTTNECLLPPRDPRRVRLRDVVHAVRHPPRADVGPDVQWPGTVAELNRRMEKGLEDSLGEETLAELLERSPRQP